MSALNTPDRYFLLFSNCEIVFGRTKALLYDLQKSKTYELTLEFANFIAKNEIINFITPWKRDIQFLLEEELIFEIYDKGDSILFPRIDFSFKEQLLISNAIVEGGTLNEIARRINLLIDFGLKYVTVIVNYTDFLNLKKFIAKFERSKLFNIEIFVKEVVNGEDIRIRELLCTQRLVTKIVFNTDQNHHESSSDEPIHFKPFNFKNAQVYRLNIRLFSESQTKNNYFNGKVTIKGNGDIKNGLLTSETFGNVNNVKSKAEIQSILKSNQFQKFWNITKSDFIVCSNCEYRFMCIDNREPIEVSGGKYSHITPCDYNPFTGKWREDVGFEEVNSDQSTNINI